jgi:hypothetical protein
MHDPARTVEAKKPFVREDPPLLCAIEETTM